MTQPDAVMAKIGEGIGRRERGDRESARQLFAELWEQVGPDGDPFHRCALAHSMADVQDDVRDELAWDLRALEAADELTDARVEEAGVATPVAGFYPSLHLNLGDAYRRLGELEQAREHLVRGRAATAVLGDDGYAQMIREAFERLASRLAGA
jgi:hypothetical protein